MTRQTLARAAAEKLYGSKYQLVASGFRDVGCDELVDLFVVLLDENKTRKDIEVLFENHPSTISMDMASQKRTCPDFNDECDCFLPSIKGKEIWCVRKRIEARESTDKRNYPEYQDWRSKVFERDDYTCKRCGYRGGELNAHHIKPYKNNKKERLDLNNGITLCKKCHVEEHKKGSKK